MSKVPARLRLSIGLLLGRAAEAASRMLRLGAGGVIGGRVLVAVAPSAARDLAQGRHLTLVSGTNGKTTTTAYLTACLRTLGPVDTNADGANTRPGFVRSLAAGSAPRVVLETDEGWLPWAIAQTAAEVVVLLNLSRDQLHRNHEVRLVAQSWGRALDGVAHVVANVDDPSVVLAALGARTHTWVGLGSRWTQDSGLCPRCGAELERSLDDWWCYCGLRRPSPQWWLEDTDLVSATDRVALDLELPGQANQANAAMAIAAAAHWGVDPHQGAATLRRIGSVAGRYQVFERDGRRAQLILAKNPASWLEALEMVAGTTTPVVLAFNSEGVDGRDPSWLYDVPLSRFAGRPIVVTGRRATDMLVRLEMAGLHDVLRADDAESALALLPPGPVSVIANYTAFQEAREVLDDAG